MTEENEFGHPAVYRAGRALNHAGRARLFELAGFARPASLVG